MVTFAAVVLSHAGMRDTSELRTRAHEAYLAGRFAEAEMDYRGVLAACLGQRSLACAAARENLGVAIRAQGRGAEARPMLEAALAEITALAGPTSPEAIQAARNMAALYWTIGELAKAGEMALRAGDRTMLASVYVAQRRFPEAAELLHALLPSADDATAVVLYGNLAATSLGTWQLAEAEKYARQGVELGRRALPEGDPKLAVVLNNLAQVCRFTGRYLEAERDYREALAIWEKSVGPSDPDYARGLMNLAAFYHERDREAGAEQLYSRAAAILEKADPALALVARNELADVLRGELRYTEARKLARSTLRRMEAALPADDPRLARARDNWERLTAETQRTAVAAKAGRP